MKKFAVILAGCGSRDGSEIHETTMILLSIKQLGAEYQCFSINKEQKKVVNFVNGEVMNEKRNVMIESARIARGNVKELKDLNVNDFDGIILPGGMGMVLNYSTYVEDNYNYEVNKDLKNILQEFKENNKVICATCIAPMILAKVFKNITITLGSDNHVADIVNKLENTFQNTQSGEICVDIKNKIITTPFYMLANNIKTIYDEAYKMIDSALNM